MKPLNKIKRSILRITLSVISVLGICYIGYLIWTPEKKMEKDSFYIWQRDWKNRDLAKAINRDATCDYYFLAGEYQKGKIEKINPDNYLYKLPNRIVPVYRIHLDIFKKYFDNPDSFANIIICEFRRIQKKCHKIDELQIDLDCPESKLANFAELLKCIRGKIPKECKLSFTALPCHVSNAEFKRVAKFADYYVLQVHGLEYPANIKDKVSILNLKTAQKAIRDAENGKTDFLVALPTYAYQLNFDKKSGKFLFLNAEKTPTANSNIISKIIAPEFKDIAFLVNHIRNSKNQNCKGIIWFRLPVNGDRFNIDSETLGILQKGSIPKKELISKWEKETNGTLKLFVKNKGILKNGEVNIRLKWKENDGVFDLFRDFYSDNNSVTELPQSITGEIPLPGKSMPVGWFRTDDGKIPTTEIQVNL